MKYKNRLDRIKKSLSNEEEKLSRDDILNDALDHWRPNMVRYADIATSDRTNGNTARWQHSSFAFIAAAYCTYLRDKADIPQFLEDLMDQKHTKVIDSAGNDKAYYFFLWIAMKIIVPEVLDNFDDKR